MVTTFYNSSDLTMVSTGQGGAVTAKPRTLGSNIDVVPSSSVVKKTGVTYTVSFTTLDPIPQSGSITLTFPPEIQPTDTISSLNSRCYYSLNPVDPLTSTSCIATLVSNKITILFNSLFSGASATPANTNIKLEIRSAMTNPLSTQSVESFGVSTFGALNDIINTRTEGVAVKMTEAAGFTVLTGVQNPQTNSALATYTLVLNQLSPMEASSKVTIVFPPTLTPQPSPQCTDAASTALPCQASAQTITITLPSPIPASTDYTIKITSIKNSYSFQPNLPLKVTTFTPNAI